MNKYLIKYEFLNTLYNGYAFFFGAIFPVILLHLIVTGSLADVPDVAKREVVTEVFIGMAMLVPLATVFLSHAATYSNELDKSIPDRLMLFGFSQKNILASKLISNFIFLAVCFAIYVCGTVPFIQMQRPTAKAVVVWVVGQFLLSAFLMMLAHGIAGLIRKFGITYGVVMGLYFGMMILSGYMGIPADKLPKAVKPISDILMTKQLGNGFIDLWMGREYNFAPLIQSTIFMLSISLIILIISFKYRGRKN